MVAKEDKDGQIALLKEALEKIKNESKNHFKSWEYRETFEKIEHIAETALFDVTF